MDSGLTNELTWHEVYWRTHGCDLKPGHTDPCWCGCGDILKATDEPFGPDAESAVMAGEE